MNLKAGPFVVTVTAIHDGAPNQVVVELTIKNTSKSTVRMPSFTYTCTDGQKQPYQRVGTFSDPPLPKNLRARTEQRGAP